MAEDCCDVCLMRALNDWEGEEKMVCDCLICEYLNRRKEADFTKW